VVLEHEFYDFPFSWECFSTTNLYKLTEISPKKSASGGGFTPTGACRMAVAASGQTPGTQGISPVFCWENARSIAGKIFLVDFLLPFFF